MDGKKSYATKQRDFILSCLRENRDRPATAEMITDYLKHKGNAVGQTTVYRHLDKLARDGAVLKFISPEGAHAQYQYLEQPRDRLYHLICVDCGRMTHLECNHMDRLTAHIQKEHGFNLDSGKTILYGRCQSCGV